MAKRKHKNNSNGTLRKIVKNQYSKGEIINIALGGNYFIALLYEELGEEGFGEMFHILRTNPEPTNETFNKTWMMLDHR